MTDAEGLPIPPHFAGELYAWLWWRSEEQGGVFDLDRVGRIELWVDERLAFRNPDDARVSAVMTGENPSTSREARAALAGGKVLQELRLGMRRDDREFTFTLRGPAVHLAGVKLPQVTSEGTEEAIHDRMALYEELCHVIGALTTAFAEARTGERWSSEALPALREWVGGAADGAP